MTRTTVVLVHGAFADASSFATVTAQLLDDGVDVPDRTINPDVERFGYERAGATTVEVDSSHLVMLAHPDAVVRLIRTALSSVPSSVASSEPKVGADALGVGR